ncbi:LamG-like jellyroll fold domain-containing protein [Kutzneria chonburiensis]|uniref:LamG-like jellyroll fold domain-containing protein n=1 Tax=Kutzneria chonburiensis TaxID=1483604 RepID=A0ABV6MVA2_9PSEU|nr:LamG-like jellyroll fold domain-containing protein [Kutzneria chonburiensis]
MRRFASVFVVGLAALSVFAQPAAAAPDSGWHRQQPPLSTPWTDQVGPDNALPEYPRPQLVRQDWRSLNGVWQFGTTPPAGHSLPERILVPYPVESALSGIMRHESTMWYRRTFTVPESWHGQRVVLNFGAVDYQATVSVNGHELATHKGGYDAFSVDVTDALTRHGDQELVVGVVDPTEDGGQPIGKQRAHPVNSILYTPSSGIWQSVWLEPVPKTHVTALDAVPDLATNSLQLTVHTAGMMGSRVEVTAGDHGRVVARTTGRADTQLSIPIKQPHLWSPDDPFLYDLTVRVGDDRVTSYFGMRSISIGKGADGKLRTLLNGRFVFSLGTLDQGFWPDGIYTAPTDSALRFDLAEQKSLGFNTVRKHIKVEPDRWYYWADKLGLMVWQDMPAMNVDFGPSVPSTPRPTPAAEQQFMVELHSMVDQHVSHPSIVEWVPFNEGWGEFSPAAVTDQVKAWDPSRLVNNNSGLNCCYSFDGGNGDVYDNHAYVGPGNPIPSDTRAAVDGEFGGLGLIAPGHEWQPGHGGSYEMEPDKATLTSRYVELLNKVKDCEVKCGLSAAIYTQATDVENEVNGLFTYDRKVLKPDQAQVRAVNKAVIAASGQATQPTPPPPGTPGLTGVGSWPLDGVGDDSSGHGHALALQNGPVWTDGHSGQALELNGANQWADTNSSILDTTTDYSVAAWVRLDKTGRFATAVSQDRGDGISEFFLQYSAQDNRLAFSTPTIRALGPTPQVGVWYHLVGEYDSVHSQLRLYVNGQLAGTAPYCPGEAAVGHTVLGRALYNKAQVDFWPGALDGVHVYDRALSAAEIDQLYRSDT